MVVMMVGHQNMAEPPALSARARSMGAASGASMEAVCAACGIMDQHAIVVAAAEELMECRVWAWARGSGEVRLAHGLGPRAYCVIDFAPSLQQCNRRWPWMSSILGTSIPDRWGHATRRLVGHHLRTRFKDVRGATVLGLGYALPYLDGWRDEAERIVAFMPARQGVARWPQQGPGLAALVDDTDLPLSDASIDVALVVHELELTEPHAMLRELWRVMAPQGRVIFIVPNRRGMWARFDSTPFGHGRPFSRQQLRQMLGDQLFSPLQWDNALFVRRSTGGFWCAPRRLGAGGPAPVAGLCRGADGGGDQRRSMPSRAPSASASSPSSGRTSRSLAAPRAAGAGAPTDAGGVLGPRLWRSCRQ
jgi:SAM-dependent methyltransferase